MAWRAHAAHQRPAEKRDHLGHLLALGRGVSRLHAPRSGLFTFSGTPTEAGYGLSRTVWLAPGQYDYSEFDRPMLMVLEANPHAYIFPRLYLHAPAWWSKQHPDDVVLEDRGDGHPVPFVHAGGKPAPSWASEACALAIPSRG